MKNLKIERTTSENKNFIVLVSALDKDLAQRNGEKNDFFAQFNKIDHINHVVVVYAEGQPVGCGAMKQFDGLTMEIKRMFVPLEKRGNGIASLVLQELENWAGELEYKKCVLETGEKMPEAIALYKKNRYRIIPNYGQYANVESSICFEKELH